MKKFTSAFIFAMVILLCASCREDDAEFETGRAQLDDVIIDFGYEYPLQEGGIIVFYAHGSMAENDTVNILVSGFNPDTITALPYRVGYMFSYGGYHHYIRFAKGGDTTDAIHVKVNLK